MGPDCRIESRPPTEFYWEPPNRSRTGHPQYDGYGDGKTCLSTSGSGCVESGILNLTPREDAGPCTPQPLLVTSQGLLDKQRKTRCIKHLQGSYGGNRDGKTCLSSSGSNCMESGKLKSTPREDAVTFTPQPLFVISRISLTSNARQGASTPSRLVWW